MSETRECKSKKNELLLFISVLYYNTSIVYATIQWQSCYLYQLRTFVCMFKQQRCSRARKSFTGWILHTQIDRQAKSTLDDVGECNVTNSTARASNRVNVKLQAQV